MASMKTLLEVNKTVIRGYTVRAVYYSEVYGVIMGENVDKGNWVVAAAFAIDCLDVDWFGESCILYETDNQHKARDVYIRFIQKDLSFLT